MLQPLPLNIVLGANKEESAPDRIRDIMNPKHDRFLAELLNLQLLARRDLTARNDEAELHFWQALHESDYMIAMGEREFLLDFHAYVDRLVKLWHIETTDLPKLKDELAKWKAGVIQLKRVAIDSDEEYLADSGSGLMDGDRYLGLVHNGSLIHTEWASWCKFPYGTPPSLGSLTYVQKQAVSSWQTYFAPVQAQILASNVAWCKEMRLARRNNALSGNAAKNRLFLLNENIPTVNDTTLIQWLSMAGGNILDLSKYASEKWSGAYRRNLTHMMFFLAPMLPRTKEHRSGGGIMNDDSSAGQSLGGKSAAHERDEYGRIQYGLWRFYAAMIGPDCEPVELARYQVNDTNRTARGLVHTIMDSTAFIDMDRNGFSDAVLPPRKTLVRIAEQLHTPLERYLRLPFLDPNVRGQMLQYNWMIHQYPMDTGYRACADAHNIHFKFTGDSHGDNALDDWVDSMYASAQRYISLNQGQRLQVYHKGNADWLERAPPVIETVKVDGQNQKFDLSRLFNLGK